MAYEKLLNEIYAVVSLKVSLAGIPAVFCKKVKRQIGLMRR